MQLEAIYVYCRSADVTDVDMEEGRGRGEMFILWQNEEKKKMFFDVNWIEKIKCAQ